MGLNHRQLDRLSAHTKRRLESDLAEHGAAMVGKSARECMQLLGKHRGRIFHAWLRVHGAPSSPFAEREKRPAPAITRKWRVHLVIGDCHAAPNQDARRFEDAAKFAADLKPDVVVQLGDWYSLDSLCRYQSLSERSGQRVLDDLQAGELALDAFHRHAPSGPEYHITFGNHDDRIHKMADDAPWFEGLVTLDAHEDRGWRTHGYRRPARIDGVRYQHDLPNATGRAIGGKYAAHHMLQRVRYAESIVVGHSHRLQILSEGVAHGTRRHAISAGCWLDHIEDYAGDDNHEWWSGLLVLAVHDGQIGEIRTMERGIWPGA